MTNKNQSLRNTVKANLSSNLIIPATVIEQIGDRVTVRLSGTGQILRNLSLSGGPCIKDQSVSVDMSTRPFTVKAKSLQGLSQSDLDSAIKQISSSIAPSSAGSNTSVKISLSRYSNGVLVASYDVSASGLTDALDDATSGDVIWIPRTTIVGDFTIPSGVHLVGISPEESVIKGKLTITNCNLTNLKIVHASYEAITIYGLDIEGEVNINNCQIHAYHCGVGYGAVGIGINDVNAVVRISNSLVIGYTMDIYTDSYAIRGTAAGECTITNSRVYGGTAMYDDGTATLYVGDNVSAASWEDLEFWCEPTVEQETLHGSWQSLNSSFFAEQNYYSNRRVNEVTTLESVEIFSSSTLHYPHSIVCRGDYIYIHKVEADKIVIREWQISTSSYNDVEVASITGTLNSIKMILATDRVLYVYEPLANKVYRVSFYLNISEEVWVLPTATGGDAYAPAEGMMLVPSQSGEYNAIVYGKCYIYDEVEGDHRIGLWIAHQNITLGTDWTFTYVQALLSAEDVFDDDLEFYAPPFAVQNRYVTIVPTHDRSEATHANESAVTDVYAIMFVYDIVLGTLKSIYNEYAQTNTDAFEFLYAGVDHPNGAVYASSIDKVVTGTDTTRVYKFDPINETITVVHTTGIGSLVEFVQNNKACYILDGPAAKIYLANGLVELLSASPLPGVMDENNNMIWRYYGGSPGVINGYDPATGRSKSFTTDISDNMSNYYLYPMNRKYLLYGVLTTGPVYKYYLIKEA